MPIKSKRTNLSISPNKIDGILDVGRKNHMQSTDGNLSLATICTKIVYFFVNLHKDDEVSVYLKQQGCILLDLIPKAVKFYISHHKSDQN